MLKTILDIIQNRFKKVTESNDQERSNQNESATLNIDVGKIKIDNQTQRSYLKVSGQLFPNSLACCSSGTSCSKHH